MRITTLDIQAMKDRGERIAMITAYEYSAAKLLDQTGIHMILVGDSMGVVVLGYENTLNVTVDDIVRHAQAVMRGSTRPLVVADLPFMSYQVTVEDTLRNAGRLMQTGVQAVKLEGGTIMAPTVERLVNVGIPVVGHIGLTPQSIHQMGGYKVQGKSAAAAAKLLADAQALQAAGAFAIVLEGVPAPLAARVTKQLSIPTIGIGAGVHCDGQVQVFHDLLGMFTDFVPRHVGQYAHLGVAIQDAVRSYVADVTSGAFPTAKQSFTMDESILAELGTA
jgi:3-methyl-2-oxobutanoate hydroxymethyltransferase